MRRPTLIALLVMGLGCGGEADDDVAPPEGDGGIRPAIVCGDRIIGPGESCDDGNRVGGDGCGADCTLERCGDGLVSGAEQCDTGAQCNEDCTRNRCGDRVLDADDACPGEPIDLGVAAARVLAGDVDGDGDLDLVGVGRDASAYLNDGAGNFTPRQPGGVTLGPSEVTSAAAVDLDRDRDLDVVFLVGGLHVATAINDGSGLFSRGVTLPVATEVTAMTVTDVNLDGAPDVALAGAIGVVVHLSDGTGAFTTMRTVGVSQATRVLVLTHADFAGDAAPELIVGASTGVGHLVEVLANDGRGFFTEGPRAGTGPLELAQLATGDVDRDGDQDVLFATRSASFGTLRNLGGTALEQFATLYTDQSFASLIAVADLDRDGDDDVVTHGPTGGVVSLQLSPNALVARRRFGDLNGRASLLLVDLDGDQAQDIVTASPGIQVRLSRP